MLGVPTRADTVEHLGELMQSRGVEPLRGLAVYRHSVGRLGPDTKQLEASPRSNSKPPPRPIRAQSPIS